MIHRRPRRRAFAVIPALVCLVIAAMICGALLRQAHTLRALAGDEERRMQAEWLAESGLARASARLAADPGYKGETWEIAPKALGGRASAVVTITAGPAEGGKNRRRVRVEADYPRGGARRARHHKHVTIDLGPETNGGPP